MDARSYVKPSAAATGSRSGACTTDDRVSITRLFQPNGAKCAAADVLRESYI